MGHRIATRIAKNEYSKEREARENIRGRFNSSPHKKKGPVVEPPGLSGIRSSYKDPIIKHQAYLLGASTRSITGNGGSSRVFSCGSHPSCSRIACTVSGSAAWSVNGFTSTGNRC